MIKHQKLVLVWLNHLFEVIAPNGTYLTLPTDLLAVNINRGRDHGVPSYTKLREFCGLKVPQTFADLSSKMTSDSIKKLKSVYQYIISLNNLFHYSFH